LRTKVSFPNRSGFKKKLKERIDQYFIENQIAKSGDWRMFLKTGIILSWVVGSYVWLVFFSESLWSALLSAFALAQGFVLVGFNIMHDGAHGSYSQSKRINALMAWTLDLMGGSRVLWRQKHNILHHTYTNIEGLDEDISSYGLLRLSPRQERHPWHRLQHLYAFPLYGLLTLSWISFSDFHKFFSRRIGDYTIQRPSARETALFLATKVLYFGYALALPLWIHPPLHVLAVFLFVHIVIGFTLALVFQLAHTVEGNAFPSPDPASGVIENEWSIHEVETTADFAPRNKLATWYLGGLNFQIEHHLFPKICHIHYPSISALVRQTCRDFGITYTCYPSVGKAILAHIRFLRKLGKKEAIPIVAST
jgi:linoleoyl-CoA desaturase